MSCKRRGLLQAAAFGLLLGWSPAAMAQDLTTLPLESLIAQASILSPDSLFMLAGRLFEAGRHDEAVVWFYIAQLRARFRLAVVPDLKLDGEPAVYGALFETIGPQINGWAFGDIDRLTAQLQEALDWDSSHANAFTPKTGHEAELEQVHNGLVAFRTSVLTRKEELRRERTTNGLINR